MTMKKLLAGNDMELWEELNKLFDLPDHCSKLVITMEPRKVVTIDFTASARSSGSEYPITKRYNLVDVESVV